MEIPRIELEEAGFEALQRLYEAACTDTGQAGVVGCFLLGLYNGKRFPFDLTDLRRLDDALFNDCMQVLTMDARLTPREIHQYFSDGVRAWLGRAARRGPAAICGQGDDHAARRGFCPDEAGKHGQCPWVSRHSDDAGFGAERDQGRDQFVEGRSDSADETH